VLTGPKTCQARGSGVQPRRTGLHAVSKHRGKAVRQDLGAQWLRCLSRPASQPASAAADTSPVGNNTAPGPLLLSFLLRKQGFSSDTIRSSGFRAQSAWGWRSCRPPAASLAYRRWLAFSTPVSAWTSSVNDTDPDGDCRRAGGARLEPRRNLSSVCDSKRYTCW